MDAASTSLEQLRGIHALRSGMDGSGVM